ncbi:ECF RNA polymerase sigma factor SigK [Actinophytocola sediminis]
MVDETGTTPDIRGGAGPDDVDVTTLMRQVGRGDESAFERLYDQLSGPVYGLIRRVVRDPAQSEEVAQDVMVELWRTATRYAPERGSVQTFALTLAHRRAVDRVRSEQAAADREHRAGYRDTVRPYDEVAEQVTIRLEQEQVRRCLATLTELQRESVMLTYYGGRTSRDVGELLGTPLGTIKTRLRDGLIRLRDCLGVSA